MIKTNRIICGTVRECVTEIVHMIDWGKMTIPDFDFCADCDLDGITEEEVKRSRAIDLGESWYGARNVNYIFNGERYCIALLFGYFGGGGHELVEIDFEEKGEDEMIIDLICKAIQNSADLKPEWDTVFELFPEGE